MTRFIREWWLQSGLCAATSSATLTHTHHINRTKNKNKTLPDFHIDRYHARASKCNNNFYYYYYYEHRGMAPWRFSLATSTYTPESVYYLARTRRGAVCLRFRRYHTTPCMYIVLLLSPLCGFCSLWFFFLHKQNRSRIKRKQRKKKEEKKKDTTLHESSSTREEEKKNKRSNIFISHYYPYAIQFTDRPTYLTFACLLPHIKHTHITSQIIYL